MSEKPSDHQIAEFRKRQMTGAHVEAYVSGIVKEIGATINSLRARVEELEARTDFVDRGVWTQGLVASKHHGVTFEGSYWIAQRATMARPGTPDSGWRLAVKRGKDAR